MFKKSQRVFYFLILLTIILIVVDLPEKFNINFNLLGKSINQEIKAPFGKYFKTHLGLDLSGGTHLSLEADMTSIKAEDKDNALESAKQVIDRRVNFFGVSEPVVQTAKSANSYRIIVELPGVTNLDAAVATIGKTALLEFREFTEQPVASDTAFIIPFIENTKSVGITGADLKRAQISFSSQTGEPEVAIEFNNEGAKKFAEVTSRLVGKQLAIFLDQEPLTWPTVRTPITDGAAVITGSFSRDDAKTLALQLNAGALPIPINIVEKKVVGATLGQESVANSIKAGIVGLIIVAGFMIAQYGRLGLLADLALVLYGLIALAIFRGVPITLTLPGIAGFLLSIGMAVDSNILIFERFKEEKRLGKPWQIAMELGFGRAWDSIRDANITTILTALILYNPGNWQFLPSSGLVRGFAATLLIGVLISLFTGIVVTRTLIRVLYREK